MHRPEPALYLDLVDPGSLVMLRRVRAAAADFGVGLAERPFEIRPPPHPMVDPADPAWLAYWEEMRPLLRAQGVEPGEPRVVPWTRKAHELVFEAREAGCESDPVELLLRRYVEEGLDLGRVDLLLAEARRWGMELTRTKATLDVDRHASAVEEARAEALERGVRGVPTLWVAGERLEGIHETDAVRRLLGGERTTHT
jgi:predicted DsbA family dithiol-disulfide isomerase